MSFNLQQPFSIPLGAFGSLNEYPSFAVPISDAFNNQAASRNGVIANFDGQGSSYDAAFLPNGTWVYDGITVRFKITPGF